MTNIMSVQFDTIGTDLAGCEAQAIEVASKAFNSRPHLLATSAPAEAYWHDMTGRVTLWRASWTATLT